MIEIIILIGLFWGSCPHNPKIHMKDNKMCLYARVGCKDVYTLHNCGNGIREVRNQ